ELRRGQRMLVNPDAQAQIVDLARGEVIHLLSGQEPRWSDDGANVFTQSVGSSFLVWSRDGAPLATIDWSATDLAGRTADCRPSEFRADQAGRAWGALFEGGAGTWLWNVGDRGVIREIPQGRQAHFSADGSVIVVA